MNVTELLAILKAKGIQLAVRNDQLIVQGNKQALTEPELLARLREYKPVLIGMIRDGSYSPAASGQVTVPANAIEAGTTRITPAMLPLANLDQEQIDRIVAQVPGGVANVQDIYPLAPLQEGILFHHASATQGDPYVMQSQFAFADLERLTAFAQALQKVIDRHDILRTAVLWEGLESPVQVVWRKAELVVEEVLLEPHEGEALQRLHERFDARHYRLDVSRAPLIRLVYARDEAAQRLVAMLLFHHMALDHSALDVVRHEMGAFLRGQGGQLGQPVPFRNYVAQARLGISQAEHESFFREMLAEIDEPTLPYGLQDVQGDGTAIDEFNLALEPQLNLRLRALARQQGASVASLFHLAWGQVLAALSGRRSVVFGTVLMGRMQGGGDGDRALGIFINTLPVRVDIGGLTVQAGVRATQARLTALMRHEHAPLALAQRCSGVEVPTPLFSSLLNYRHNGLAVAASASDAASAWHGITPLSSEERTNYPLTLSVDDQGEDFRLALLASSQIDGQRVCDYMRTALEQLAQALEQSPQALLEHLSILPMDERELLLKGFNASQADYRQGLTLHQRIAARAAEQPQAVAAVCQGQSLSYAELNRQAEVLAHHLGELGVRPDQRVAIVARRGLDTLVGLLAILKAGAGYVPIDPAHPAERLRYLLDDSAPVAVLTQDDLLARLPELAVPVINLDKPFWQEHTVASGQLPTPDPRHLAYVIYTSGSTGLPKGVMVEHHTVSNLVDWHCAAFDLCPGRHTSSVAGFGFDAMAWEVWPALCAGATLHLPPPAEGGEDVDGLLDWWCAQPLDVSFLPTPIAEHAFARNLEHPTLRTLLIGGDRLRQFSRNQTFEVINNYGPTEATVVATSGRVEAGQLLHIGKPMSNARVYLLDERQRPVPLGVAGELYVGGAGVARGYLNRPELTAERFLHDPFSDDPRARMYRTGDLARWQLDGTLEYLGRNDDQVKIRGMRIELGEIESRLNQLPGIQEAVVLAREDQPGQARLVAYFTEQAQVDALQTAELRAWLQAHLPDYMVPAAYVKLAALPLTANGKLDRRALPRPELDDLFTREYEAPEGELEITLAQIWSEVLQVERVGRRDHFFELGGHSLLAMRMVAQVRQRLGVELALAQLFANAELAAVAETLGQAARSTLPDILAVARDQALPLSFAQQRLWFLAQMGAASSAYNIPVGLGLHGPLDSQALQRALARIVERHETLRSRFVLHGDEPRVEIAPVGQGLRFAIEDLRATPDAQTCVQARLREEAGEPFDLQQGPLIRGRLLCLADRHHVLLLTLHHIVSDGWSMGVLTRELMALYEAFRHARPDPLPPLAVQYGDFAVWQRRWLDGELLQQQGSYWQQALAGAPALLMVPTDRPRPARQDYAGATIGFTLDERLSAAVRALGQRHGTTPYMTLLAAWALLLGRLSGQHDLVIGSPVANRQRAEVEGLVGLFVNTLAIRLDVSPQQTVEALLAQVRERTLQAQAHQDLPFEQVVELTRPERSLAHSPLFQSMFSWQNHDEAALQLGDLQLEALAGSGQFAKFDLALDLGDGGAQLVGSLTYATALFDAATIERYLGYLRGVLQAMVDNDQASLGQANLLDEAQRVQLLQDFNASQVEYPRGHTLHGLFERQVERTPDAVAVRMDGQALSYRELNRQANQLAHHLRALGVQADERVAICVTRGPRMLVGLLAILKAGGAYVPVDPAHPAERIRYLLEDSAPLAVLVQGNTRELAGRLQVPLVDLDQPTWHDQPVSDPHVAGLAARHLAYVIYTSGSTGLPKGVMVEHGTVENLVHWHCAAFDLRAGSHTASVAGVGFDAMVWEVWPALCVGATLHLPPASLGSGELDGLLDWWRAQPLQVAFLPTPVAEYAFGQGRGHPTLRTLLIGGDRLRHFAEDPGFAVINNYGPTEATVVATSGQVEPNGLLHIGRPIANARLYLLDEQLRPVPVGVAGELYVGGAGVARGYLHRPELTAERFLDDPFSTLPQARMYRTGDLARWRADGTVEYLGRNDDQVKIRGVRIELGEIEASLNRLPGVREAVVLAREDEPGQVRLVAYLTEAASGGLPEPGELRAQLATQLPEYMVPVAYVRLDALPLTANGKLDRRALPAPALTALSQREYQAPEGELENTLARIWGELLQVERVGRRDHFFELGGHSLLAMRMVSQVRLQLQRELPLGELFANPELAAVARFLQSDAPVSLPAIVAVPRDGALPLSFAQQRLWFLAQMDGANSAYNIPVALRLRGQLQAQALQQALATLVARHETLRSRFVECDETPQVLIAPVEAGLLLQVEDLRQHPQAATALEDLLSDEARAPFDLARGPLIRGRLVIIGEEHHVLLLTLHHIIADGWSMDVLTRELVALYAAFSRGEDDPLPPLALQYGDFAVWQRQWLSGEVLARQNAYWQQALSGAPALLMLPTDRPRPARQDYAGGQVEIHLDASLSAGLRALGQRHGLTLYMTLMAGWGALLARLAGQDEVVIGSPVANRQGAEIEGLIGLFVNTLAIRLDVAGAGNVAALLAQVRQRILEAQAHQDLPFEQVVELIRPARSLAHSPLFQTLLTWQAGERAEAVPGGLQLEGIAAPGHFAKFDLSLNLGETQGCISGGLVYATALFDESTMQRYAGYFERLLRAMVADDQARLARIDLLDMTEREHLLGDFNATDTGYNLAQTLHGLFQDQVEWAPEAVALQADEERLTYRALNQRANQLAHHLREQGVEPDARVAICVERGLEMVVGLLAILKAGGAYVPLDPAYPQERIAYMLADSAPAVVLVQGRTRDLLAEVAVPVIDLDCNTWHNRSVNNPWVGGLTPRHSAYVIYTSGSTGQPKGVINEHAAVVNRLLWMQDEYGLTPDDAVLQKTPFSFDVSVWEFFWPLFTGARLVMARPQGHKDPLYLSEVIQAEQITTLHFVPSMLDVFLAHGDAERCASVKRVMCSGEALPGSVVRRFKAQLPGAELHNLYGPTEAAVDVTAWNCAGPIEQTPDNTPIGKPIANTRMYLLDPQMQPVPLGVVGELYIGGVQVARGYLNRPELTAERFLDDPFSTTPEARMYRTGDVGRYLADGNIEYLGRNDDQVKIRGLRIELGEIQARLTAFPAIQEAVVVAREDVAGDKRLVAYYTAAEVQDIDALRAHLLEQLPDYMVPALFVHLAALPLSPNGKLDRKALPAPDQAALVVREYEAPLGETEILMARLWAQLLKVERVGRHDNFFELGGHSLLAVSLIGRMRRLGLTADVRVLFGQPTLAAFAASLGAGREIEIPANRIRAGARRITPADLALVTLEQEAIDRIVASVPGGSANVQDIYPLAPLQAGILYHHLAASEGDPYLLQAQFAFASRERLDAFSQALGQVIERNDILRSAVLWDGLPEPLQVVLREAPLVCEAVSLDPADGEVSSQLLARFDTRHYRLDITRAPLLRLVHCADPANGRIIGLLLFHHLVMDHVALEVLQQELQACLLGHGERLGAAVPYRNYVAQARLGMSEQEHETFFREQLGDIDEPTLPFGLRDVQSNGGGVEERQRPVDPALSRRLRQQARQLGVSAASLVHLAWARLLGAAAAREQVVFGTVLLGRLQGGEGAERALGVFINTLPLRVDIDARPVREALQATHGRLARLLAHEHAPLALMQRCSGVAAGTPLFSALLNYRHGASATAADDEVRGAWQGIELLKAEERTNYLLTLSVDDLGEDFALTALAPAQIGAQRVCDLMHAVLENLAQALEQQPTLPIEQLSVLPGDQRRQLLDGFNATTREYPHLQTVHRLFEAQALARPEAQALVHGTQSLSYHALNARANRLAHHLLALGVAPGDTVAILLERSADLLASQLAISKCAAVYVPLDINAPVERQRFMLEDSRAVLLLTRGDELADLALPRVELDSLALDWRPEHNPDLPQSSETVAYLMYTSGSTGTPKGVLVPHRAITRLVINNGYADFNEHDRVAFASNPAFDASTLEVWAPLLNGGCVVVVDQGDLLSRDVLGALLQEQAVSVLWMTAGLFQQYADGLMEALRGLRYLIVGGDVLDPAVIERVLRHGAPRHLLNGYGPTEATTFSTTFEITTVGEGSIPIGRPIGNARAYVLDARRQPVPVGVVGELYVGGAGVAKGYLNQPELTAEKFLADPFNPLPDSLMYRTGDLVRWRADGNLEYLGRNDGQVKIRGFRIELGEIETRLGRHPQVREVVVQVHELAPGDKRLVAYFTAIGEGVAPQVEELRNHLLGQLPDYMVPSAYVRLPLLPLTANGKLDRKALPVPLIEDFASRAHVAPANPLEQTLAQLWADVLKVERIGRHDNFFELGGHSLLAIRLVNLLEQAGLPVSLAELFQHASVESLATLLSQRGAAPQGRDEVITVRAGGSQPGLFLVHEFSGADAYFPVLGQHLPGDFPIYGLPGIALGQPQLRTMECLAARLVELIREVQPQGPYRLAGWSFGGVLAYEIAIQLLGQDQPVQFLGLLDSYVPRLTDQGKARWAGEAAHKRHLLLQCSAWLTVEGPAGSDGLAQVRQLEQDLDRFDFDGLLEHCRERQLLPASLGSVSSQALWPFIDREVAHGHALAHYRLHPIGMPVHLFRAGERTSELARRSESLGWAEALGRGELRCIEVPGDHLSMMQAPHVQVLGQALGDALERAQVAPGSVHQPLLTIQQGRAGRPPIFCVPGAGDSVTGFIGLTDALGPDWPVIGLQPRGLDGESVPHSCVESAAQLYLQALEQACPEGPLHLVGHSFGGWVAFEMATRLQAAGREVASLTLIDSESPGGNSVIGKPYTTTAALQRLVEAMQLASGKSLGIDAQAFAEQDDNTQLAQLHAGMVRVGLLSARAAPQAMHGPARTFASALRTVYRPQRGFVGRASLVLADDPTLDAAGNQREQQAMVAGWSAQVDELTVWYGPGNHFSLLKAPAVSQLAAWWLGRLSAAVEEGVS
ncbi:amino acid adenylation domain-containing protein [Pseudomonas sp. RHF3.3-3]|uniref:amino acid adenylation domain-containing protein n=1 Tax=Pseudomonas sp. RHF3.3-3 TaxID=3396624 RepID=UPI003A878C59